jgi:hypothetical protein
VTSKAEHHLIDQFKASLIRLISLMHAAALIELEAGRHKHHKHNPSLKTMDLFNHEQIKILRSAKKQNGRKKK